MELLENQKYLDQIADISVIAYWVVFVFGLVGNLLVICVILIYARMKTVTNIYIFNLALVDCLSMLTIPMFVQYKWTFGHSVCRLYTTSMTVLDFSGSFLIAALSVDRYFAICQPNSTTNIRTLIGATVINVLIWIMSTVFALPLFYFTEIREKHGVKSCKVYWPDVDILNGTKVQFLYTFTFGFLIPFAVIVIFYLLILCRLRHLHSAKGKSRRRRVTFLVLTLITVYFFCWLPYWIGHIIFAFFERTMSLRMTLFTVVAAWLSFANSAINPILYAFTNSNFTECFANLFRCGTPKEKAMSSLHSGGLSYYGSAKTEPSHSFVFQSTFDAMNHPSEKN